MAHGCSIKMTAVLIALCHYLRYVGQASAHEGVLNFHGSGTTNPSKCYWSIMEQFEARTKHPIRATFRAIGTTTGIDEFINGYDPTSSAADFGSGDFPLNKTVFDTFLAKGIEVVQLPVLLGAVSIFHSVPVQKLNLTACLLARIFRRDITHWTHYDIVEMNPELSDLGDEYPISVGHHVRGSGSTHSVTNYLHKACPELWPIEMTGPLITWPSDTLECEGSAAMTDCIKETPGTIGYIDSGHGIGAGLAEIELENEEGNLLSSAEAAENGGIEAAEAGVIPARADADFSEVSLLNQPGKYTWPMVQMTYIYVRKNITFMAFPDEQSLMVAFLKALYTDDYIQQCVEKYGFTLPSNATRNVGLAGIEMLQLDPEAHEWTFESSTLPITGSDNYTISSKRQRIADIDRAALMKSMEELNAEVVQQQGSMQFGMTDTQEKQLKAALVLASLSFFMCFVIMLLLARPAYSTNSGKTSGAFEVTGKQPTEEPETKTKASRLA